MNRNKIRQEVRLFSPKDSSKKMIPGCNIVTEDVIAARKRTKNQIAPNHSPPGIKEKTDGSAMNPIPNVPKSLIEAPKKRKATGIVIIPPIATSTNSFKEAAEREERTTSLSRLR